MVNGKFVTIGKVGNDSATMKSPGRPAKAYKVRKLEGRLYMASDDAVVVLRMVQAYTALLKDLGFGQVEIIDIQGGSVWVKLKQSYIKTAEKRKVRVMATQLLAGVEGITVEKFQADNTATHAKSVSGMIESAKHLDSFSFDSGPLQYVQFKDEDGKTHGRARVIGSKDVATNRLSEDVVKDPKRMVEILDGKSDTMRPVREQ